MELLDQVDETAGRIGAVNTVINDHGCLKGINTDWTGAMLALEEQVALSGRSALVVGAGGSARAVCMGLAQGGAKVHVANRTERKARELAELFNGTWSGLDGMGEVEADILVNTTSVGMNQDLSPVAPELLPRFQVVMDLVYCPLETRLLREARAAGCATVDGTRMLLLQGAAQFQAWTGKEPPLEVMGRALEAALNNQDS